MPLLEAIGVVTAGGRDGAAIAGGANVSTGGTHWVHILEVEVLVIVETVVIVCTKVESPDVMVFVTGQVVRVVTSLYMSVNSSP